MTIDKELFLPEDIKSIAYIDDDIYLNESRYYLSNLQIAQLIQNANLIKPQIVKIWNELDINADIPIKIDQISKIIMKRG